MRILTLCLVGLALAASPAAATGPTCPDCGPVVPSNNDCGFSSVDAGAVGRDATALADTDLCVGNSDTYEEKGFWAVLSICLEAILGGFADALGLHAGADLFISQDGVDIDASASGAGQALDFDKSPVGDLDGKTWETMGQANKRLRDAGAEPHGLVPVGGEDLPGVNADACADLDTPDVAVPC